MDEVAQEVKILEQMGHKRLALELGEDPVNAPIDYVLECLDTIYKTQNANGEIRRVNVNIAATTVENYRLLKEKGITTYKLIKKYNVSSGLIDRLKHNGSITTKTINDLCILLDCKVEL